MKKGYISLALMVMMATAIGVQAQVKFKSNNGSADGADSYTYTFTDVSDLNLPISGEVNDSSGFFSGGEGSVAVTFEGLYGYTNAAAMAATNNFSEYLAAMSNAQVAVDSADWGVNSSLITSDADLTRLNPSEIGVFTFDTSALTVGDLLLQSVGIDIAPGDYYDFILYHPESNSVDAVFLNGSGSGIISFTNVIHNGSQLLVAMRDGQSASREVRIDHLWLDISAPAPASNQPPFMLSAVGSNAKVLVDWRDDQNLALLDHYDLYRSTTSNEVDFSKIISTTDSVYTDEGVTNKTTYYYMAKAVGTNEQETEFGNMVSATPAIPVPSGLSAAAGNGEVVLDWDDSVDELFDSFTVYRSSSSGTNYTAIASNLLTSVFTDTDVMNERTYYYVLSQVDVNGGDSDYSGEVSAFPTPALIIVNPTDNRQGETRSYPTGINELYSTFGSNHSFGNMKVGAYLFQALARPVLKFGFDRSSLGEKTTNDIEKVTLRLYLYENNLSTNGLSGRTVEVYASQTKGVDSEVWNSDFENPTFALIGTIEGVTNGAPVDWYEIDVTEAVMTDLTLDVQDATAGSVFRVQVNDDLQIITTNEFPSIRIQDNRDTKYGLDYIPQLRIEYVDSRPKFVQWASRWGVDIGVETNDYDKDGLNNLYEYGLNGDPTDDTQASATLPSLIKVGDGFEYITPLRSDDINLIYTVQTRSSLMHGSWTNIGYSVEGTDVTGGTLNFVTNSVDTLQNQKFIRLLIEN